MGERFGLDRALLLHRVQVDPLPELVLDRDRVRGEAGQAEVGPVRGTEDLRGWTEDGWGWGGNWTELIVSVVVSARWGRPTSATGSGGRVYEQDLLQLGRV